MILFFITLRALFGIVSSDVCGCGVLLAMLFGCVVYLDCMVGVILFAFVVLLLLLVRFAFALCGVGFMLGVDFVCGVLCLGGLWVGSELRCLWLVGVQFGAFCLWF